MSSKAEMYAQMADQVAVQLTKSWQEWAAFLTTASRLYKYPYHEQMMIYAQRPDATACAEYDLWNNRMGRYIKRGSRGIALVDDSGDRPRLRYVFDVSDTGEREHARRPYLWVMQPEYVTSVTDMIGQRYGISAQDGFAQQLADLAGTLAEDYWNDNQRDILRIVDDSFLEEYDELNIGLQFKSAATISITYSLMSRCGLEPEQYFDHEDFMAIFDFNTPATVAALGTAVSQINQQVLRQIGVLIQNIEREKVAERSKDYGKQPDLHTERRLSDSQPETERSAGETAGQVRQDEEKLSEGAPPDLIQPASSLGEVVSAPAGDRRDSEQPSGEDDAGADESSGSDGAVERERPDAVGGIDEQLQSTGGGDDLGGAYQQLTLNLFPSENEQIKRIDEAESRGPSAFSMSREDAEKVPVTVSEPEVTPGASPAVTEAEVTPSVPPVVPETEAARPVDTQAAIDAAIQEWNGDIESKHAVVRYMKDHARDKNTAVWLQEEYGDSLPAFPVPGGLTDVPWPKVQRRIAQLIKENQFYTREEHEQLDGVDPAAVQEEPEQAGSPTVREIYGQYLPIVKEFVLKDVAYQNACKNSDRENAYIEGDAAIKRAVLTIEDATFINLYYGLGSFHNNLHQDVLDATYSELSAIQPDILPMSEVMQDLSEHSITREGDTITIGDGPATHEIDITVTDEEWQQIQEVIPDTAPAARDPLAPAYQLGDTVYLDDKLFVIEGIGFLEVQLRDPSQNYPIFREESKENLERLLLQDSRNGAITEYLSADLRQTNEDLLECLVGEGGMLNQRDKEIVTGYFRTGEGNTRIAQHLAETYAGTAGTMQLVTGETADYIASTVDLQINLLDKYNSKYTYSWQQITPILRSMYQQELYGLSHEPIRQEQTYLEGTPFYEVGDAVVVNDGNRIISGTVGYVGDTSVRVDTGPYSWSNEVMNREQFEEGLRRDERNADLFTPETKEATEPEMTAETVAVYPGDKNGLPYDVVVERLHMEEPEHTQPGTTSAAGNFHITDENLGVGDARTKFRANMDAINTLQGIELEGRMATGEEQEILSRYVGWGSLSEAFDPDNEAWKEEYLELSAALSPSEYEAAKASTLNAHYTSPTVIQAVYDAVRGMGFQTGNILEPSCGVGNFFGMLPEEMAASRLYGVELDSISGRIAKQLYPKAEITVAGYETTQWRDFFDLAVGNVPFGNYHVNDRDYNKLGFNIHNYFFAKALDQVRPGGVVAFVTSRYTMDMKNPAARKYLAERAELLGAIRLPSNAFKANAGTNVVSDIIFLQKRDRPIEIEPDWVHLGQNEDGFAINSYFIEHPEMILGRQSSRSTQYGRTDFTVDPIQGLHLSEQLHDAVKYIRGTYQEATLPNLGEGEEVDDTIPADPNVKNYSYTVVDDVVYYRENSRMVRPELNTTAEARIKGMAAIRDCVYQLIDLQMDAFTPDSVILAYQAKLNRLYDDFTVKYGLISDRGNRMAFSDDSSYYLLCSLEVLDEDGKLKQKADMFSKRTIQRHKAVTSVDTASEALAVSIAEKARVDMEYMSELTGKSMEEIVSELKNVIFKDPAYGDHPLSGWQTADEYLSGNVRRKLRRAQRAAERDPAFAVNVEALKAAQPKDLDASEIEVRLGATWIDPEYIREFMYETFDTHWRLQGSIDVIYTPYTAEWRVKGKNLVSNNDIAAYTAYGTERANAYRILEDSLNLRDIRIYDTIEDADGTKRRVLNAKETTLAAQKQNAIREAFRDWIWRDPQRRQTLVKQYNEEMNSTRPREYDGSHIVFSGMNPEITLREHQKNAIAHVLYGGNTLLAHEVGAGKTFEMVAAAMESKRLGLCSKSMFVVPNHLIEQWASEFLRLYPAANILVTTKKDFEASNRKKFCARIATGDYDAIIISHSQFEKIPISKERQERLLREQIQEIADGIYEVETSGGEKFTIKQLERTKKGLEARLEKLRADHRKDDVVTFEQLGVDRLFVDEAHYYKNSMKRCFTR